MKRRPKILYINSMAGPYDDFWVRNLGRHFIVYSSSLGVSRVVKRGGLLGFLRWLFRAPLSYIYLRRLLRRLKPDILFSNYAITYGVLGALSGFRPNILNIWGSDILLVGGNPIYKALAMYSIKHSDMIIVDSEVQRAVSILLGGDRERIFKIPWFDYRDVVKIGGGFDRDTVRRLLGWEDKIIVISTRNHYPIYSVDTLMEAVSYVVDGNPDVRFLIVGSGSQTPYLRRLARGRGVEEFVRFTGFMERGLLLGLVKASDIYVSTSLSDGSSASLLEAMSLGVAPVVTDIPGNREWVFHGYNGFLFRPRDHVELAKYISVLAGDPGLRRRYGSRCVKIVSDRADWDENSRALWRWLMDLI